MSTSDLERLNELRSARSTDGLRPVGPGSLSTADRLRALADPGSVFELAALARSQHPHIASETPGDGLHTAFARVHGIEVMVLADVAEIQCLSDGEVAKSKRQRALELARMYGLPVVMLADSAQDSEKVNDVFTGELLGRMYEPRRRVDLSSRSAPLVVGLFGLPLAHQQELLGSADLVIARHSTQRLFGQAEIIADDDASVILAIRDFFRCLVERQTEGQDIVAVGTGPGRESDYVNEQDPETFADLLHILADQVEMVFDPTPAGLSSAICRIGGRCVIIGAAAAGSNPSTLSLECVRRLRRLVDLSSRLDVPLLLVQNCLGYNPEVLADSSTLSALLSSFRRSSAPRLCLVTGVGHLLGSFALGAHELGIDVALAWPWAQIAVTEASDYSPETLSGHRGAGPWLAAGFGLVDDVVTPSETRDVLGRLIQMFPPPTPDARYFRTIES